ncbi:hypothetical protein ES707_11977 [subsurface metagenome]
MRTGVAIQTSNYDWDNVMSQRKIGFIDYPSSRVRRFYEHKVAMRCSYCII